MTDTPFEQRALHVAEAFRDAAERLLILAHDVKDMLENGDVDGARGMLREVLEGQPGANAMRVARAEREAAECTAPRH